MPADMLWSNPASAGSAQLYRTEKGGCPVNRDLFNLDEVPASLRDCFEEVETACGSPWVCSTAINGHTEHGGLRKRADAPGAEFSASSAFRTGRIATKTTTGWAPSCSHDADPPIPQTVLDPFLGSGTTALVADRLGRDAIGIELNPQYARMARDRIDNDAPMVSEPVEVVAGDQLGLFEAAL